MRTLLILMLVFLTESSALAQGADSSRTVQAGDSVFIAACPEKGYNYLQYYQKTRFPNPASTYNKETGDDFYEYFFLDGDFDVKPLPCSYGGHKYRIIGLRTLTDKISGADRPVMFLDLGNNTVVWVELNGAVQTMEIYLE